jgi:hypothetical protein
MAIHVERRKVRCAPDIVWVEPLQCIHVGTGTEGAARAGDHDDADIVIGARCFHRMAHVTLHDGRPRIHAIGTVERDGRDLVADLVEDVLIGHRDLPVVSVIDFFARPFGRARSDQRHYHIRKL